MEGCNASCGPQGGGLRNKPAINRVSVKSRHLVDEKVLRFEITVKYVMTVTELKTSQQLIHERLHTSHQQAD